MENRPESDKSPVKEYERRARQYGNEVKRLAKTVNLFSNLRLLIFVSGFGLSFYLYMAKLNSFGTLVLSLTIITFLYL
nr:hypothetical protein [Desulfitobacterium hafniense]